MSHSDENGHPGGVDVAIPCYEYGRFLRDCVVSVLTQRIRDLRVLIIDNASTDNSLEIAQQLAAEDPRVEVVAHGRNLGHHASFNEGIDWARAKYFMILCADDLLAPNCLPRAVSFMEEHPDVHLTYGRYLNTSAEDPMPQIEPCAQEEKWQILTGREFLECFCRGGPRFDIGNAMVVRTSVQKQVGYYRPALLYVDDVEMWLRFACFGALAGTSSLRSIFRSHQSNRSNSVANAHEWHMYFEAAFDSFFAHEGACLPDSKWLHRLARRSLAEQAYWGGLSAVCRGQTGISRDLLRFAFRLRPTTAILPPVSYLFHREDAIRRIISVASEAVGWSGASARTERMGG
jgi:glycosyltransferase involved in cell wall biosynthesis